MAGYCVICKNLEKKELQIDGKILDTCRCSKGKYDAEKVQGFISLSVIMKGGKIVKDIQESCEEWDDSLKGKS